MENNASTARPNRRKKRVGVVVSDKMQKTIVVRVYHKMRHSLYGKVLEKANKYKVHDEKNQAKIGDRVQIEETRPLSKDKRWRLVTVLQKGRSSSSAEEIKEVEAVKPVESHS